jgi:hypothetical protein
VGIAHSHIAYRSALTGLGRVQANPDALNKDLDRVWEVLAGSSFLVPCCRAFFIPFSLSLPSRFLQSRFKP